MWPLILLMTDVFPNLPKKLEARDAEIKAKRTVLTTLRDDLKKAKEKAKTAVDEWSKLADEAFTSLATGSAYTAALFKDHYPELNLGLLSQGFKSSNMAVHYKLADDVLAEASAFTASLNLVSARLRRMNSERRLALVRGCNNFIILADLLCQPSIKLYLASFIFN